jgi:hypothetical protein
VVVPKTRQPQWLRAAAALVVVALGVTIGALSLRTGTAPLPVAATAKLASVDAPPSSRGKAIVEATKLGFDMEVETKGLPKITGNEYYEVWLFNPRTNKMLPIGMLKPDGVAHFTFSKSLMDEFSAIDVSLQVNNGVAAHSDISVLRGPVHLA